MKEKVKMLDKLLQFSLLLITYAYQVNYGMQFYFLLVTPGMRVTSSF